MNGFDKIIGYESIKEELMWYCDILKDSGKYRKLGVKMPNGLLLYGEPGVGKSLMANCFVDECGCKAYTLRKNLPNGAFVKEIKKVFDEAMQNAPSIVLLDDVDKFANCDYSHTDAEEYVTIQSCMDECRNKGVFVIATANDKNFLPDSLLRKGRFDVLYEISTPGLSEAEKIIEFYLKDKQMAEDVDSKEIAKLLHHGSCAMLENVINEAGIYAGYHGRKQIHREDIVFACIRSIFEYPIPRSLKDDRITGRVALHEAGHVVVSEVLEPGSVAAVGIGVDDEKITGFTRVFRENGYRQFVDKRENEILCDLGSVAAVEVIEGDHDLGCLRDLQDAQMEIESMLNEYCIYGFETYNYFGKNASNECRTVSEQKVALEQEKYLQRAKKIISENRVFVGAIMAALLEKKYLAQKEIAAIRASLE